MKNSNTFTWSRLMRTMVALLVIMSMLLCGCAKTDDGGGNGGGGNGGNSGNVIFGDGDGSLEAKDFVDGLTNLYGAMLNSGGGNRPDNFGYEMSMEVTIGDMLLNQLGAALGQAGLDSNLSWFESVGVDMQMSSKGDLMQAAVDAKLNGQTIVGMDVIMDIAGNMGYIGIPELSNKYIASEVDFSSVNVMLKSYLASMADYSAMMEAMPTDAELNSVLTRYLNVVLENLDEPTAGTKKLSAGGVDKDVSTKTYTITQKNVLTIAEQIMRTAKTDSELESLLDGFSEALNLVGEKQAETNNSYWNEIDLYEMLMESIDPALESLEEAKQEADDTALLQLEAYVDGEKQIGFALRVYNGYAMIDYVNFYSLKDGKNTGLYVNMMGAMFFTGAGTMSGNKVDGEYVLSVQNKDILYLELKDFDMDALQKGQLKGTVRLSLSSFVLNNILGNASALPISEDSVIELVFGGSKNATQVKVNLYDDDTFLFGITLSYKLTSGSNIKVPSNYVDANSSSQMSDWVESLDLDGVLNNLKSAGVPKELLDMLESAMDSMGGAKEETAPTYPGYYG